MRGYVLAGLLACAWTVDAAEAFLPAGRVVLGANYWASHAATQMWSKWDADAVEKDLATLEANGMTMLRVFANWADFQPIVEIHTAGKGFDRPRETRLFLSEELRPDTPAGQAGVDERMMARFEAFCDLAQRHNFRLIVCPLTGQMTFRLFQPPSFEGKNIYTDPYCLKWSGRYLRYFVERLKGHPAIAAWEVGNEIHLLAPTDHPDVPEYWLTYMHNIIRRADPSRPVIGPDGPELTEDRPWNSMMVASVSDYLATHPYGMWGTTYHDDITGIRNAFFCSSLTRALADIGGKPAFVEEHGARRQEQASRRHLADYMRGMLWNVWDADCRGMLWWCAFDQTGQEIAPYDWPEPCVELGLFRRDRTPYPAVQSIRDFAAFQKALPFKALPPARPDALFIVSDVDVLKSSYILARQAGIQPSFQSAEQPIRDAKVYFLPNARGRARLTLRNWSALKQKVRAGATLYLSWDDTFLDSLEEVAGIEIDRREAVGEVLECAFPGFDVVLGTGVKRSFRALTAETLARDKTGRGVFFRNKYGAGTVYTLGVPMESRLYKMSGTFKGNGFRIYGLVCPVSRLVETGARDVTVTEHAFSPSEPAFDGMCGVVVVNNAGTPYAGTPKIREGWQVARTFTDNAACAKWSEGKLELAPNSGILLMLKRK